MCGIFALLNNDGQVNRKLLISSFEKGKHRGPEFSVFSTPMIKCNVGFHRLAINGLDEISNQPIIINHIILICNGEIYNYEELYNLSGTQSERKTNSDCEVIIHLYLKYGMQHTLQLLDGVFSFVLIDSRMNSEHNEIYVARDPYGIRPLFYLTANKTKLYKEELTVPEKNIFHVFASEMKSLTDLCAEFNNTRPSKYINKYNIRQFTPGTYSMFHLSFKVNSVWELKRKNVRYHNFSFYNTFPEQNYKTIFENLRKYLTQAVHKRCSTSDRPIACLLSGGLDSSLIAGLVNEYHVKHKLQKLKTFSIGVRGSQDLIYAKMVAEHLNTDHNEVIIEESDFFKYAHQVIYDIESYDTTSVRASIGNWLIGKYISENCNAKVIFNGDGADELMGGYIYMSKAPDGIEFDKECKHLLRNIHQFDVLRSDRCISSHGLEPRTPFLDKYFTQYYLSIHPTIRFHKHNEFMEKWLIRSAFSDDDYVNNRKGGKLLPDDVMWRRKEAFSDGVSEVNRSLYRIMKDYCYEHFLNNEMKSYPEIISNLDEMYTNACRVDKSMENTNNYLLPSSAEEYYYRKVFETFYPGKGNIIPYFWMPKYVNAVDSSARTLEIYNN